MSVEQIKLNKGLTLEELTNAIHNEEVAGFVLVGMSLTKDNEHNVLLVKEFSTPEELALTKVLTAAETDQAGAQIEVNRLHDALPATGGVIAWGKMSLDRGECWVAAYRNKGLKFEEPSTPATGSALIESIVGVALKEWEWFGRQEQDVNGKWIKAGIREDSDEGSERVRRYWKEGAGIAGLTGKHTEEPWSAAFISYVMQAGGAGPHFREAASHQVYIFEAIKARKDENKEYGYWAYELGERPPEVGDLICAWRTTKQHTTAVNLQYAAKGKWYPSHCDLVVEKTGTTISVIGGNVGQSVSKKTIKLVNGLLTTAKFDKGFAVLGCNLAAFATASPTNDTPPETLGEEDTAKFTTCSADWEITGYFSPVEKDYSGDAEEIEIEGMGEEVFASSFLGAVRMEGWGKTRFGWYLGYYSKKYHRADFAKDALGKPLKIGSVAVDRREIAFGRQMIITDLPDEWGKRIYTAVDVGGKINAKHIDVYCGEGKEAEAQTRNVTKNSAGNLAKVCFA